MAGSAVAGTSDRRAAPHEPARDPLAAPAVPSMVKEHILKEDGRYLIFYSFPDMAEPAAVKEDAHT